MYSYNAEFEIRGIRESSGLRIRTLQPLGLYVSLQNEAHARSIFFNYLAKLVFDLGVFPSNTTYIAPTRTVNWDKFIELEYGCITFRTYEEDEQPTIAHEWVSVPEDAFSVYTVETMFGTRAIVLTDSLDELNSWALPTIYKDYGALRPNRTIN